MFQDKQRKNNLAGGKVRRVLKIIGAAAVLAGIVYAIYRFFAPDYGYEFEEDFDEEDFSYFDKEDPGEGKDTAGEQKAQTISEAPSGSGEKDCPESAQIKKDTGMEDVRHTSADWEQA